MYAADVKRRHNLDKKNIDRIRVLIKKKQKKHLRPNKCVSGNRSEKKILEKL